MGSPYPYMPIFERRGSSDPAQAERQAQARLEAAQAENARLKVLRAYREAQLEEALPDLEAEARLQVDEELALLDLEEARLSGATDEIQMREEAHARAFNELTACRTRIEAKDRELRLRFGVPEDADTKLKRA